MGPACLLIQCGFEAPHVEHAFGADHMEDGHGAAVAAVENTAGRFDDLAITGAAELRQPAAAIGLPAELFDVAHDAADKRDRGNRALDRDVVVNRFEVGPCGLGPDYLSHFFAKYAFTWACVNVRPSASARSPRAMPSRIAMRDCCSS